MIKKLKTIKKLQTEFRYKNFQSGTINLSNDDGGFEGKILKSMFEYFGEHIDVEKSNETSGLENYDWMIKDVGTKYYFQDNWFELDVDLLLEDDLFDI